MALHKRGSITNMVEERLESAGGVNLCFRSWLASGQPRGVVVIVPGFNSHSGYYGWVAEQLSGEQLSVFALDLRGRGKSDGERFYVSKFADYVSDLKKLVATVKSRQPDLPIFLLGHSAGGIVSCLYALENQPELSGLICESFAYRLPAPDFALAAIKGLSHIAPHAHVLRTQERGFQPRSSSSRADGC